MSTVCPTDCIVAAGTVTCAGVDSASRLALHLPTLSPPPPPEPGVKTESRRPETREAAGGRLGRILTLALHSAPPDQHTNDQDFDQHNRDLEAGTAEAAAPGRAANAWLGSHTVVRECHKGHIKKEPLQPDSQTSRPAEGPSYPVSWQPSKPP
ncbi:hypothetical protein SprV_1002833400 [Sparganum proliferum]